jgi:integrase
MGRVSSGEVPLSVEEARVLLGAVTQDRHQALWVIMLMLGLRRSEVCGLRWEHVDLTKQTLRIAQSVQRVDGKLQQLPTKTRRSNRTVPLPAKVVAALRAHEEASGSSQDGIEREGFVFATRNGTPLEPRNLTRMWTELCERHGMRHVPLHTLRHTCVSLLQVRGIASDASFDGCGDRDLVRDLGFRGLFAAG